MYWHFFSFFHTITFVDIYRSICKPSCILRNGWKHSSYRSNFPTFIEFSINIHSRIAWLNSTQFIWQTFFFAIHSLTNSSQNWSDSRAKISSFMILWHMRVENMYIVKRHYTKVVNQPSNFNWFKYNKHSIYCHIFCVCCFWYNGFHFQCCNAKYNANGKQKDNVERRCREKERSNIFRIKFNTWAMSNK